MSAEPQATPTETLRSKQQVWSYMASEVFQTRYLVAAHYLRNCDHILEVGGCSTPITNYLQGAHASVTVVDPLVEPLESNTLNNQRCVVRHLPQRIEEYSPSGRENGFVALGMPQLPLEPVLTVMRTCDISVLEFPVRFLPSCLMFKAVLDSGSFDVSARIVLDLSRNDIGNLHDPALTERHLFVLRRRHTDAGASHLSQWLEISNGYLRAARRYAWRQTLRDRAAIFMRHRFQSGYAYLKGLRDSRRARLP
jgi:hypothetical protein